MRRGFGFALSRMPLPLLVAPPVDVPVPTIISAASFADNGDGTLTLVPGVFAGANGQDDVWLADYIPVTAAATIAVADYPGKTLLPLSTASNAGGSTPSIGATAYVAPGSPGLVFKANFAASDDTPATSLGFAGAGDAAIVAQFKTSGGLLKVDTYGHPEGFLEVDAGSVNHSAVIAYAALANHTTMRLMAKVIDASNWIALDCNDLVSGQFEILTCVAGVTTTPPLDYVVFGALAAGDKIEMEANQGQVSFYKTAIATGERVQYQPSTYTTNPTPGIGTYAVPAALAAAHLVGLATAPYGYAAAAGFEVHNLTQPFGVSNVQDDISHVPLPEAGGRYALVTGTYTGSAPATIDLAFVAQNGSTLVPRKNVEATIFGGNWKALVQEPGLLGMDLGGKVYAQAWKGGDATALGQSKSFTPSVFAAIEPFKRAMNIDGDLYFHPSDKPVDLMEKVCWLNDNSNALVHPALAVSQNVNCNMDYDGVLYSYASGSVTAGEVYCLLPYYLAEGRYGAGHSYTLAGIPAGITVVSTRPAEVTLVQTGTSAVVTFINQKRFDSTSTWLRFTGPIPQDSTPGAKDGGLNRVMTLRPTGDASTVFLTPQARARIQAEAPGGLRFMQGDAVNNQPVIASGITPSMIWNGSSGQGENLGWSLRAKVAICNEAGVPMWWSVPEQFTSDAQVAALEYIRDNLDPRLPLYVQLTNENWNFAPAYVAGFARVTVYGLQRGWDDAAATPATTSGRATIYNNVDHLAYVYHSDTQVNELTVGVDYNGSVGSSAGFASGTLIFGSFTESETGLSQGWNLIQLTSAVAAGGKVSTANATVVANDETVELARTRAQSSLEKALFTNVRTVFAGAPERARCVHGARAVIGGTQLVADLAWDDLYASCRPEHYCVADYWDMVPSGLAHLGQPNYDSLGQYTPQTGFVEIPGWGPTEHAHVGDADQMTLLNYFFTGTADGSGDLDVGPAAIAIDSTNAAMALQAHDFERAAAASSGGLSGYVRNGVTQIRYEGGSLGIALIGSWMPVRGANDGSRFLTNMAADPRMRTLIARKTAGIKDLVGGTSFAFIDIQPDPDLNLNDGTRTDFKESNFGFSDAQDDTTDPRLLGWLDVVSTA